MSRLSFCLPLLLLATFCAEAQKVATLSGQYIYYAPETVSVEEAKRTAEQRAKIQALADEFGTIISQSNSSVIVNQDDRSSSRFQSLNSSDVRGEWIEDLKDPEFDIRFSDGMLVVGCKVKGKARQISEAQIQYEALPLKNGTERRFASTEFKNGDDLFLLFRSPENGFLMVFLLDETTQTVYSILPYKRQSEPAFTIDKEKDYILFSIENASREERSIVDEYTLTCENEVEFNTLYLLFSPEKFYKSSGYNNSYDNTPSEISYLEFRKWLGQLLAHNSRVQLSRISLSISK